MFTRDTYKFSSIRLLLLLLMSNCLHSVFLITLTKLLELVPSNLDIPDDLLQIFLVKCEYHINTKENNFCRGRQSVLLIITLFFSHVLFGNLIVIPFFSHNFLVLHLNMELEDMSSKVVFKPVKRRS